MLRLIDIRIPKGSILDAQAPAAVCVGNTETTQRVADTVLRAFAAIAPDRIPAASQGTMNLISVGGRDPRTSQTHTYIETICGGQGGRPHGSGMDAVQVNMTNTMNTPIESLEISYPLRVESYELRDAPGGGGLHPGGQGVERSLRVIGHASRVSLQADRRLFAPYGLHGDADGAVGENSVMSGGEERRLPGKGSTTLRDGDVIVVRTPGGGGWGTPARSSGDTSLDLGPR